MRHLLGGVALAALLAAGLPAAAQNNGTAPSDQSTGMSSGNESGTTGETGMKHKKHTGKHKATKTSAHGKRSPADNMAEQLNREELEKVQQNSARVPTSGSSMTPATGKEAPQQ